MLQKKICMLGTNAVGKTSLVRQFVESVYSDKYHTTVAVKVDKKVVQVSGQDVTLMLWDLYGEDEFQKLRMSFMRGASGYFLVADGTRRMTLDRALALDEKVRATVGSVPVIVLLNKSDLADQWEIDDETAQNLVGRGLTVIRTSAKTGEGVDAAFHALAQAMVAG
jgi:small GTP-binding protein